MKRIIAGICLLFCCVFVHASSSQIDCEENNVSQLSRWNREQMRQKMSCVTHCLRGNVIISRVFPLNESLFGVESDLVQDLVRYIMQCRIDDESISQSYYDYVGDPKKLFELDKEPYNQQIRSFINSEVKAFEEDQKKFENYKSCCEQNAQKLFDQIFKLRRNMACFNAHYVISMYRLSESESTGNQISNNIYFNEVEDPLENLNLVECKKIISEEFQSVQDFFYQYALMEVDKIYLDALLKVTKLSIDAFDSALTFYQKDKKQKIN